MTAVFSLGWFCLNLGGTLMWVCLIKCSFCENHLGATSPGMSLSPFNCTYIYIYIYRISVFFGPSKQTFHSKKLESSTNPTEKPALWSRVSSDVT
ncbi:hypothetical protein POVWA2_017540 [Plasmodium ovale wallikeri]|uniref:Uncharacterized protein n=1 Tax=Plasmodium ovale wallikeri TaxID=864142 RepID=A0A1A8YPY0_PLAOA|nr:hypothetical protein POVWA1_017660 [Plasmodium ovale wallikeri]SBT33969.1 hypothetical protein POVWA2_017540 [Plasmodium ovale wallikeri]